MTFATVTLMFSNALLIANLATDTLNAIQIRTSACRDMSVVHASEFPGLRLNYRGRLADANSFTNTYYNYAHCRHFACFSANGFLYCAQDGFQGLEPSWGLQDPRLAADPTLLVDGDDRGVTSSMDLYSLLGCVIAPSAPVFQILGPPGSGLGLDVSLDDPTATYARRGAILCLSSASEYARLEPASNTLLTYATGGKGDPFAAKAEAQAHLNETTGDVLIAKPRIDALTGEVVDPLVYLPGLENLEPGVFFPLALRAVRPNAPSPVITIDQTRFGLTTQPIGFGATEDYPLATDAPFAALRAYVDRTDNDKSGWARGVILGAVVVMGVKEAIKVLLFVLVLAFPQLQLRVHTELFVRNPVTTIYLFVRFLKGRSLFGRSSIVPEEDAWQALVLDAVFEHIPTVIATLAWLSLSNTIGSVTNVVSLFFTVFELVTTMHRVFTIFILEFCKGVDVVSKPFAELGVTLDDEHMAAKLMNQREMVHALMLLKEAVRDSRLRYRAGHRREDKGRGLATPGAWSVRTRAPSDLTPLSSTQPSSPDPADAAAGSPSRISGFSRYRRAQSRSPRAFSLDMCRTPSLPSPGGGVVTPSPVGAVGIGGSSADELAFELDRLGALQSQLSTYALDVEVRDGHISTESARRMGISEVESDRDEAEKQAQQRP